MWMKHYTLDEHETRLLNMTDKEFDRYKVETYPEMFVNRFRSPEQTYIHTMNFGFEIGCGWRHILDRLCKDVSVLQKAFGFTLVFDQVKEKLATARFYCHIQFSNGTEVSEEQKIAAEVAELIADHYESYTNYVCEELGTNISPSEKISINGWHHATDLKGFKHRIEKSDMSDSEKKDKIRLAEACHRRNQLKLDIRSNMSHLNEKDLEEISSLVEAKVEKHRRKANYHGLTGFLKNLF